MKRASFSSGANSILNAQFPDISPTGRVVAAGVVGGTGSVLGGGKFMNGAATAAFETLFNALSEGLFKNTSSLHGADQELLDEFGITKSDLHSVDINDVEGQLVLAGGYHILGVVGGYVIVKIGGKTFRVLADNLHFSNKQIIRNSKLAGKIHPVTKVPFDEIGFPDFKAAGLVSKEVKIVQTGKYKNDFNAANLQAGFKNTPDGFTWHHHQDGMTMQLVPTDIHKLTGHTGGKIP